MDYVRLGNSGLKVSRIALGMMSYGDPRWRQWVLDEDAARPIVARAAEAGVTFFDTADIYSEGRSEQITGRLLREVFTDRDDYVLATKVCSPTGPGPNDRGLSRKHILSAIDNSLRRLGTDHVDLYQTHHWDPDTPIEETVQALHDVVRAGKAGYIGASNMLAWQFAKAQHAARLNGWTPFTAAQNHYNLLCREQEREMIPQCLDMGVGMIPWSPLARGLLAGTRTRDGHRRTVRSTSDPYADRLYDAADFEVVAVLEQHAARTGTPSAQLALAWLLHKPGVTAPIIGATKARHIDDAIAALDLTLTESDILELEAPYRPYPVR